MNTNDECPKCHSPLVVRPAHRYPVWSQVIFGVSFLTFMVTFEKVKQIPELMWGWCAFQVIVGGFLVRGRLRARKRVYRCVRCTADLK